MPINLNTDVVGIKVHSVDYVLKCRVSSVDGCMLELTPEEKSVDMFQENDPVVVMFKEEGYLQFAGGDVKRVSIKDNTLTVHVVYDDVKEERRIFERYPVSMSVSARRKFSNKRLHLIARNLSQYGMSAVSKAEMDIDEAIDIDLITGKYMFYFVGKIIWKTKLEACYEYGLQLTDFDVATKSSMEAYLGKLKEEYSSLYLKAR